MPTSSRATAEAGTVVAAVQEKCFVHHQPEREIRRPSSVEEKLQVSSVSFHIEPTKFII